MGCAFCAPRLASVTTLLEVYFCKMVVLDNVGQLLRMRMLSLRKSGIDTWLQAKRFPPPCVC